MHISFFEFLINRNAAVWQFPTSRGKKVTGTG